MTNHQFNINTPYFKANIQASLPIKANLSPFQTLVQLYKAYFKFATHQTLAFFKKSANVTK